MFSNLREKWRKQKEAKAAKAAVYTAISADDPAKVKEALEAARQAEVDDKAGFLQAAIDNQHLGVFKEVLAFVDDPNVQMSYRVRRGDSYDTFTYSPLHYAVARARTHDISLALANNPRANVSGEDMDEARRQGMTDVGMVLAKRIADLRRQEAAQLDKEADTTETPAPAVAETPMPVAKTGETWALMSENSVAHVTSSEAIGRKLTEIFNFDARERVQISENLKTGAETLGQPEKFETIAPAVIHRAQEMLKSLSGDNAKRSFKL